MSNKKTTESENPFIKYKLRDLLFDHIKNPKKTKEIATFKSFGDGHLVLTYKNRNAHYELQDKYFELTEGEIEGKEFIDTLFELISENLLLFDAVTELLSVLEDIGEEAHGIQMEIYSCYYIIIKDMLPKDFRFMKYTMPWGYMENRPLLRLLGSRAMFYYYLNDILTARASMEEILYLNPNDNQGIREVLSDIYIQEGMDDKIIELSKKYKNDVIKSLAVGTILAYYRQGNKKQALKLLMSSKDYIQNVINELLSKTHSFPKEEASQYGLLIGGKEEAYLYWEAQGKAWQQEKGALEWLEKNS